MESGKRESVRPAWTLTNGAWNGNACFIVGGGPSLKGFDWSLLANRRHVIAINRAVLDVPTAGVFFTEDFQVIELFSKRKEWWDFQGYKVFHALDKSYVKPMLDIDPGLFVVERKRDDKYWSKSMGEGLSYSSNSMIGALNLADILAADPIFILGLDCVRYGGSAKVRNYHTDYEAAKFQRTGDHQYEAFASDFKLWAALHLKHRRVYNLNKDSEVSAWPKWPGTYDEFFKAGCPTDEASFEKPYCWSAV